ncbi:unnamed protein product [Parnassius mnemosyne]|uniref:Uncharacterized protein n=1 Tax=Parnassius mnemosyne TaxID=213953 RepID=A0AAV1KAS3_9NEOP
MYRKIPNSSTSLSPAEMMFKRLYRTRIDLVKREDTGKKFKNGNIKVTKEFNRGDRVYDSNKWKFGKIMNRREKLHYELTSKLLQEAIPTENNHKMKEAPESSPVKMKTSLLLQIPVKEYLPVQKQPEQEPPQPTLPGYT